jgi:hypothetical protein
MREQKTMNRLFALTLALAGCNQDSATVNLTIGVDSRVPVATIARLRSLTFDVSGVEMTSVSDPLTHPFADGQERVLVRSTVSGFVTLTVTARDESGTPLLSGSLSFNLNVGTVSRQLVTLFAYVPPGDGAMSSDMAMPADGPMPMQGDMALPPTADMAMPPVSDLAMPNPDLAKPPVFDLAMPPNTDLAKPPCATGVVFCDNFESGTIDPTVWTQAVQKGGTVAIDNTVSHSGQYSVHFTTGAVAMGGTSSSFIKEKVSQIGNTQNFHVRAWYLIPSTQSKTIARLISADQTSTAKNVTVDIDNDLISMFNAFNGSSYDTSFSPNVPLDTWTCIEWEVDVATPFDLNIKIDTIVALDRTPATHTPLIDQLEFGLGVYSSTAAQPALEAWVDDIIVDKNPIGCLK